MNQCCLYAITDGEYVKIGISQRPWDRLRGLQTGNPRPLFMVVTIGFDSPGAARRAEHEIHRAYAPARAVGEWFKITPTIARHLSEVAA